MLESATALHQFIDSSPAACVLFLDESAFSQSLPALVSELIAEFPSIKFALTSSPVVAAEAKISVFPEALFFVRGAQWGRRYTQPGLPSIPWLITQLEQLQATQKQSIEERCAALVNQQPIMLFIKGSPASPVCGFSRQLVALLAQHGVTEYGSFDILTDEEVRQNLKIFANWPTYPQVYARGQLIGGLDIVKELAAEGSLKKELFLE